jgi:carbonic anhydrase
VSRQCEEWGFEQSHYKKAIMSQHGFIGRRDLLRQAGIGGVSFAATVTGLLWRTQPAQAVASSVTTPDTFSPETALQQLLEGNQRFVQQKQAYPHQSSSRLQEVAQAQHPFATILSCADSRVPAELLFDAGIGDLFDIRVAGNVITPEVLGSLEYATTLLGTPLVMVLGHERCGAVTAAVQGKPLPGKIGTFVQAIKPALSSVKDKPGDPVDNAVVANVHYQMECMKRNSALITHQTLQGKLKIVGGRYDLDTGEVSVI